MLLSLYCPRCKTTGRIDPEALIVTILYADGTSSPEPPGIPDWKTALWKCGQCNSDAVVTRIVT
jgi:hypothetical protein